MYWHLLVLLSLSDVQCTLSAQRHVEFESVIKMYECDKSSSINKLQGECRTLYLELLIPS